MYLMCMFDVLCPCFLITPHILRAYFADSNISLAQIHSIQRSLNSVLHVSFFNEGD